MVYVAHSHKDLRAKGFSRPCEAGMPNRAYRDVFTACLENPFDRTALDFGFRG